LKSGFGLVAIYFRQLEGVLDEGVNLGSWRIKGHAGSLAECVGSFKPPFLRVHGEPFGFHCLAADRAQTISGTAMILACDAVAPLALVRRYATGYATK
jgi:hypothetical protein